MTRSVFCAVALAANMAVMSVEMLSTRLLFPRYGNTVFTWSAVISIVIAGLFLGYMAGGWLTDRKTSLPRLVFLELLAAGILVSAVPLLCDLLFPPSSTASTPPLAACFIVFGLPAAALAATGPAVVGILARGGWSASFASGVVSSLAAAGSIGGTLLTTFALIPAFGVRGLFEAMGAALGLAALAVFLAQRQAVRAGLAAAGIGALAAVLGFTAASPPQDMAAAPVFSRDSRYQLVRVFESGLGRSSVRVLMLDSTQEGAMRLSDKAVVFEYTTSYRLLVNALKRHEAPRVLFIGGGAYAMPVRVAEELPRSVVEVAEIDPVVEEAGKMFFRIGETPNLRTLLADGRQALRQAGGRYDGVFVDAYQGVMAIPFHLTTREFFEEVRSALRPGGVVGLNVIGRVDERDGLFCAMAQTLAEVFPTVRVHPIHGPKDELQNIIMAASADPAADLSGVLAGTAFSRGLDMASLRCAPGQVLTDDHAPAEWLAAKYLAR
ncbi:MAG: fused MFS/spermidine synthase [Elusimicrobia bacterium]|nr:fused MFS/spermidine synthase [Elusimicrobiota bacterium]